MSTKDIICVNASEDPSLLAVNDLVLVGLTAKMIHADGFYLFSFRRNLIPPVCLELNIPSRTFLVRFDGTSGEPSYFGE